MVTRVILYALIIVGSVNAATSESVTLKKIKPAQWSFALTNTVVSKPITGYPALVSTKYHPGLELGAAFNWKQKPKYELMQNVKLGYFYHRFIQQAFLVYTEFQGEYKMNKWRFGLAPGIGYLHSFPLMKRYKLNESSGEYEPTGRAGRAQFMGSFAFSFSRKVTENVAIFSRVQTILQIPYITGYVPILPLNQLHIGLHLELKKGGNK